MTREIDRKTNGSAGLPDLDAAVLIGDADGLAEVVQGDGVAIARQIGPGPGVPEIDIVIDGAGDVDDDLTQVIEIDGADGKPKIRPRLDRRQLLDRV